MTEDMGHRAAPLLKIHRTLSIYQITQPQEKRENKKIYTMFSILGSNILDLKIHRTLKIDQRTQSQEKREIKKISSMFSVY